MTGLNKLSDSFKKTSAQRAMVLPIVLILVVLLAMSSLIMSSFSSGNRTLIANSEKRLRCRLAAQSAILEARTIITAMLRQPDIKKWPDFWRQLLPPDKALRNDTFTIHTGVTATSFENNVYINPVTVKPLIKHTCNGRYQGLLLFSVSTEATISTFTSIKLTRYETVRFIISRNSKLKLTLTLLPGTESVKEEASL